VAKALIQVDGVPLVRRQIDALRGAGVADIIVVTGVHHDAIVRSVAGQGVRLVHNAVSERGQGTSVRLGLQAADPRADGLLMVLRDQALLTSADLLDRASIEVLPRVANVSLRPVTSSPSEGHPWPPLPIRWHSPIDDQPNTR
jgi:CTP:molybdopterin cytidylyltransferase MocA